MGGHDDASSIDLRERDHAHIAARRLRDPAKPHNDAVEAIRAALAEDVAAWNERNSKTVGGTLELVVEQSRKTLIHTLIIQGNLLGIAFTLARITPSDDGTMMIRFKFAEDRPEPTSIEHMRRTIQRFDPGART